MTVFTSRQLFEKLVRLQDELQSSPVPEVRMTYRHVSRETIGRKYGLTLKQICELEKEGLIRNWVDEMDRLDAMAKKGAA
jgi:hypothetical protein